MKRIISTITALLAFNAQADLMDVQINDVLLPDITITHNEQCNISAMNMSKKALSFGLYCGTQKNVYTFNIDTTSKTIGFSKTSKQIQPTLTIHKRSGIDWSKISEAVKEDKITIESSHSHLVVEGK